ncbi:unnamed protein product [Caenorhabditis auriculariae]|uniref:Lipid-binding serum glycoprotein C-terminal domain-containing protein n=1 Tax=Caenorhabditis auriculariae TaxID=2777116 RepID=A0A8S1GX57_9PELO|nr:unnamed protein product [Caenorhabditis auriculariae]
MGDGANVFNTFSFNKWADGKREEEIDKESRRRRAEQIKRLKERLRKERALRESAGDGDLDLEALIEALQRGEVINPDNVPEPAVQRPMTRPTKTDDVAPKSEELSDEYIFNEINLYASTHPHGNAVPISKTDTRHWQYNRRNHDEDASRKAIQQVMRYLNWLAVVVLSSLRGLETSNETVKTRLNFEFFKFFSKSGHHVVDQEIPKITIPNISFPITTPLGAGSVSTDELKIDKFSTPHIDFLLTSSGISWGSRGGGVKLRGLWGAEFTQVVTVRDSGWVQAIATDIRLNLSAKVFALDGKPQIDIGECTVDIVHLDVQIGGSVISWLVNLFRTPFSALLKTVIHNQACVAAQGILLEESNKFLHSLPSHVDLGKHFYADYYLVANPRSTDEFVEVILSADVVYGNTTCKSSSNVSWSEAGVNPGMVTMWIADAVPNCFLASIHRGQLVQLLLTKNSPNFAGYLRTSCGLLSLCVGRFFPGLKQFPNQFVDVLFHTYKEPLLVSDPKKGLLLNMTIAVDLYINPMKTHPHDVLARIGLNTSTSVFPKLLPGGKIGGDLGYSNLDLYGVFSSIGEISPRFLRAFDSLLRETSKELVRTILRLGFPIPSLDNVTVADTTKIGVLNGHIRLNIDFEYK